MKIKLWSINRWLRYTGVRLAVKVDDPRKREDRKPTEIELFWVGLPGSEGWKKWAPK